METLGFFPIQNDPKQENALTHFFQLSFRTCYEYNPLRPGKAEI
jgi:hypothetical protein